MIYRAQPIKGLLRSEEYFSSLKEAEAIKGLWNQFFLLTVISLVISTLSGYWGLGTESISKTLPSVSVNMFEWEKMYFTTGQAVWGVLYPFVILFIPSLLYWTFLEVNFQKAAVLQASILFIFLLEKLIILPLGLLFGMDQMSSPFSLGVAAQYLTSNELVIRFFSSLSLFHLWAFLLQYKVLKELSTKRRKSIFIFLLILAIVYCFFSSLFPSIQLDRLM
ncbi:MAG TPA: hypothetical protein VEY51_13080 [Chondromyces sp.]|nr:hypothetical protein [Chondromyces sp.]